MICVIDNVELAGISAIGEAETVLQYTVDVTIQTSSIINSNFKFFTLSLPLLVKILKWCPPLLACITYVKNIEVSFCCCFFLLYHIINNLLVMTLFPALRTHYAVGFLRFRTKTKARGAGCCRQGHGDPLVYSCSLGTVWAL